MESRYVKKTMIAVAALSLAGYAWFAKTDSVASAQAAPTLATVAAPPVTTPDFSVIVAQNGAAVVNISTRSHQPVSHDLKEFPQFEPDDPFFQFFRRFQIPMPHDGAPMDGLGSGFIISPDGIILTNAHVVAGADQVTVKLTDRRDFKAKLIGMDKQSDIAVLRIDAKNLPTVKIGDPSRMRVGEWVLAIGSPFGFENSATAGIVSAKSRSLPDEGYVPFIQTDVAVNPGNSGDPLFNLNGEVVGINSQIYSRSGGYQGLSFAIPIDVAMKVEQKLEKHGHIEHGRLGVSIQEVNQALAESFGMNKPTGALVSSVEKGSAAAQAGIAPGDVILEFNGKVIEHSNELPPLVSDLQPKSEAKVRLWHNGSIRNVTVAVGKLAETEVTANAADVDTSRLGLTVRTLTPEERKQADTGNGLIVESSSGPAAKAGIEPGDIVVALNGKPVTGIDQLRALVAKSGKHVALLVQRGDNKIFVPIDLG